MQKLFENGNLKGQKYSFYLEIVSLTYLKESFGKQKRKLITIGNSCLNQHV